MPAQFCEDFNNEAMHCSVEDSYSIQRTPITMKVMGESSTCIWPCNNTCLLTHLHCFRFRDCHWVNAQPSQDPLETGLGAMLVNLGTVPFPCWVWGERRSHTHIVNQELNKRSQSHKGTKEFYKRLPSIYTWGKCTAFLTLPNRGIDIKILNHFMVHKYTKRRCR